MDILFFYTMFSALLALDNTVSLFFRSLVVAGDFLVPFVRVFSDLEIFLVMALLLGLWIK